MQKLLIYLFCSLLCITGCGKRSANTIASGTTGSLTWALDEDGTLTISGKGEMPDYSNESPSPWHEYRDDIISVIIGNDVSSIGVESFFGCIKIISVSIGNSVTDIRGSSFSGCISLASVEIPNSVINIMGQAFYSCIGLSSVTFGKSVTTIGSEVFRRCDNLTEIFIYQEIPPVFYTNYSGLLVRSEHPFSNESMSNTTLFVPSGAVKSYSCAEVWRDFSKIAAIDDPKSFVTECKCHCLEDIACGTTYMLKWVLSSNGVLTFSGEGRMPDYEYERWVMQARTPWNQYLNLITSVIIDNGVISISNNAFLGCSGLVSITIPNSVTCIGLSAFVFCNGLIEITNQREIPQKVDSNVFHDVNKITCILFVPVGTIPVYRAAEGWKDFVNIKEIQ